MLFSLLTLLLLHVLHHATHAAMEFHQEFTSSQRVSLRFELGAADTATTPPTIFNLFPHVPKTSLIVLSEFTPVFTYSVQLISPFTRQPLGEKIQRRVELTANQPWLNDTFTTSAGVTLSVATKISCARNFFGARCDQFCDAHLAKVGRKRCDMMGRLRCDIGWMGPHCGLAVDPRKCSCQNDGVCVSARIHNGTSTVPAVEQLICECSNGFTGDKCQIPAFSQFQFNAPKPDACSAKDACLNGAQCFPNGPKVFCSCPIGYIGEFCELSLSPSTPNSVEITANTSLSASPYSYTVYTIAVVFTIMILAAACFTYKIKPMRDMALSRGQKGGPYAMPETKTMLVDPKKKKVFTIGDSVRRIEEEDRYTMAPRGATYAAIQKKPPPPTVSPPEIPHVYV
uniref:Delta-like protein n=1 Tax=Caenorhabditis japonica TaxID=281687 RepID=A0A8R1DJ32_CAEJA